MALQQQPWSKLDQAPSPTAIPSQPQRGLTVVRRGRAAAVFRNRGSVVAPQ
jgi:hypothetical protein